MDSDILSAPSGLPSRCSADKYSAGGGISTVSIATGSNIFNGLCPGLPEAIFSDKAFFFRPAPGLAPPLFVPSFAN